MPKVIANRYRVEKLLGKGASGAVYLVRDELQDNDRLALKLLEAPGVRHLELLRHEFMILTKLKHPNIAAVHEFGFDEDSGNWFYTSEFIEGRNIFDACENLDIADKSRLVVQVLHALQYIHSRGIIHYDVKPGNVIVDPGGAAKLIDFGLATTETPVSGSMRGTIGYAAPEVIQGEPGEPRSDLYSLGAVYFEILAGRRPFIADSALSLLHMQASSDPEPPGKFNKDIPSELELIVMRLLAHEPSSRFQSANDVIRALSQAMNISIEEFGDESIKAQLYHGGFVGRQQEFENCRRLVHMLGTVFEEPVIRFITGETGIGKSRLMREIGYHAQLHGCSLISTSSLAKKDLPFGPFGNAIRNIEKTIPVEIKNRYPQILSILRGDYQPDITAQFEEIIHESTLLLIEASELHPLVITVEKLDEADDDTLAFLTRLAHVMSLRQSEGDPVSLLVICEFNTEAVDKADTINKLTAGGLSERLDLPLLPEEAAKEMLSTILGGSNLPDSAREALLELANGNPLIIEQTVRQLFDTGHLFFEAGKWRVSAAFAQMQLPAAGREMFRQIFESLPEDEQSVVETLACIERPADFELLCRTADLPYDACADAVDKLVTRRLVRLEGGGNYAFSSGSIGEVIRKSTAPKRLRGIHRRIYDYLEKNGGDPVELARHGDPAGIESEKLVPVLREALNEAEKNSLQSSVIRLCKALLERLPEHSEEWFSAIDKLLTAYRDTGKIEEILKYGKIAGHNSLWQYPEIAAGVLACLTTSYITSGNVEAALQLIENAEKNSPAVEEGKARLRARTLSSRALVAQHKGQTEEARKNYIEARDIFVREKLDNAVNSVDYNIALLDYRDGNYDEILNRADEMLSRKLLPSRRANIYNLLGSLYMYKEKTKESQESFEQARKIYNETGDLRGLGYLQINFGVLKKRLGKFEEALDAYTTARRLFKIIGDEVAHAGALSNIGITLLHLGHTREALNTLGRTIELAEKTASHLVKRYAILSRGIACGTIGDTDAALSDINTALRLTRETGAKTQEITALVMRAWVYVYLCGDCDAAEKDLSKACKLGEPDNPEAVYEPLAMLARISTLKNSHKEALKLIEQAESLDVKGHSLTTVTLAKVETLAAMDRPEDAREALDKLKDMQLNAADTIKMNINKARYLVKLNKTDESIQIATDAFRHAQFTENTVLTFEAAFIAAACAVAEGDYQLAAQYIDEAQKVFDQVAAALPEKYDAKSLADSPFYSVLNAIRELIPSSETRHEDSEEDLIVKSKILADAGLDDRLLPREGLALIGMVNRLATSGLDVKNLLDLALGMVLDLTRARRGFIILADEAGNLKHLSARNIRDEEITSPEYETSYTMVREVLDKGKPQLVRDVSLDESLRNAKSIIDLGLHSVLCAPIKYEDSTTGIVYLDSTSPTITFSEPDLILVEAFAERIAPIIARTVEQEHLHIRLHALEEEVRTKYAYTNIVGRSKPIRELFRILDTVTDTTLTVYIYGETGTGKELVAKALHYNSGRKDGPFITINCGAMTESLLEGELFGHVKGAFTGAVSDKAGLIESAGGGTLFLDEIGAMPLDMQTKLLRVIEEREVRRVGAASAVPVEIRLVCSTNVPLERLVEKNLFREDLFYRLNVVRIDLPPLKERVEDMPLLVMHFITEYANEQNTEEKQIEDDALAKLQAHTYPGNVRQLRNVIQQAIIKSDERITAEVVETILSEQKRGSEMQSAIARKLSLDDYMKEFILCYQEQYSETELAKMLGISRNSLWRKRKLWNLSRP
ncbi:MAG: tetratricopeptide repeat protein [Planctomycetota bacterium]|nr:MAG: tetratricopeptide repeat protein [Planctomycetota bacterium]